MNPLLVRTTDVASFPGSLLLGGSLGMRLRLMKGRLQTHVDWTRIKRLDSQQGRLRSFIPTHLHAVLVTDLKPHLSGDDLCPDERYEGFLVCLLFGLQINSQAKVLHSMIQQYIEASTYVVVPDRNRILFRRVFRVHHWVWRATVLSFC